MFEKLKLAKKSRPVARYEAKNLIVSTKRVYDAGKDYETAIMHEAYDQGNCIVVEHFDSFEEAKKGHEKWVRTMLKDEPEYLEISKDNGWGLPSKKYYRKTVKH